MIPADFSKFIPSPKMPLFTGEKNTISKMKNILMIEDDPNISELVDIHLKDIHCITTRASTGDEGLKQALKNKFDLIILDIMLPDMDGIEICRTLRAEKISTPVMMLTARSEEIDKIIGLETGADDYLTKPFSPRELVLRVKSVIRRLDTAGPVDNTIKIGDIQVDRSRYEVLVKGKQLDFTATEFKLLALLMERRGRVQSRDTLLNDVWGYENIIDTRTVDTHIRRLREKLGKSSDCIETVRGFGYRIAEAGR